MNGCSRCGSAFEYGSVEVQSERTGLTWELCIPCAAQQFGMTEIQVKALMDANDGEGSEVDFDVETTIEIKLDPIRP